MKKLKKAPLFLIFVLLFSSCVKDVDFSQVEDFSAKPIIETSLVYFTLNQINFFDLVNSVEVVTPIDDTSGFRLFDSKFVQENLIKAELNFEISNQFNREFTVNITFFDDNDVETHKFNSIVVDENNQNFKHSEEILIAGNTQFLSSKKIKVSIMLSPSSDGSVIDPNTEQKLEFKSSGIFNLKT